ncbi:hypothetical protein THASP1DRAFT_25145 [Thamnocephalis sphaerospora]|uniref:Monopolin complex subunit Csm1/Pcs1 C-terminal domain-containing protein n=1 Tax=Thamnocephalis sphaerospora TaxID=78915 RepID=A0A4P9XL92_9FUNG|nr:hypothetical protein THASP1DRAFT_25145 [Thamnocephalis sphaerospora]|eukprot:RKP06562.1 hypothetical protein THASP1DRAFT_25145 [Thamnocephalis sphaerospora]
MFAPAQPAFDASQDAVVPPSPGRLVQPPAKRARGTMSTQSVVDAAFNGDMLPTSSYAAARMRALTSRRPGPNDERLSQGAADEIDDMPPVAASANSDDERGQLDTDPEQPWQSLGLEELQRAYEKVRQQYATLRRLRETEAEASLARYKESTSRQLRASAEQARQLANENEQLKKKQCALAATSEQLEQLQGENGQLKKELATERAEIADKWATKVHELETELSAVNAREHELKAQVKDQSAESMNMYSRLSGLIINHCDVDDQSGTVSYECTQSGRNGTVRYRLEMIEDQGDISFTPLIDAEREPEAWSLLQEYMREGFTFTQDNASMFYWRMADCLNKPIRPNPES